VKAAILECAARHQSDTLDTGNNGRMNG